MKSILKVFFILTLIQFSFTAFAQRDYKTGIGIRAGWPSGITIKHFVNQSVALEGIMSFRYRGIGITALLEKHAPAFNEPGLNWYYGAGAHVNYYRSDYYKGPLRDYYGYNRASFGLDGIVGIEYFIGDIPFTIGVDLKPVLEIAGGAYLGVDGALTLKYSF